jgi:hypothetical protein
MVFLALRWTTLEKVLGVSVMRGFTWLLRLFELVLPGVVLSCHYSGRWRLSGGCEATGLGYLVES